MSILRKLFPVFLFVMATTSVFAQSYQGGLRGTIRDQGGAIIPGVEVSLINEATEVSRNTITNETGEFVFASVTPGSYKMHVMMPGFKTFDRAGINIGTQQFITLDVSLEVGGTTEEVSVVADAPLIETSTASNASSIPSVMLDSIPNSGRNAYMTALTVPTVVNSGNPHFSRQQDQNGASAISIGGGPVRGNNYLMDGVPISDLRNRTVLFLNIDAIAEVKVQVNTYDAQMGRTGGGLFNTTMKSGANNWHGEGHVQQRPSALSARDFFASERPDSQYWLYGGSAGGPIQKGKTFFWASTEGYRTGTPNSLRMTVPTKEMRTGDFSAAGINIYDPLTTKPNPAFNASAPESATNLRYLRDTFLGNRIPQNRMDPAGLALIQLYPEPNSPGLVNNFVKTDTLHDRADQLTGKVDHTFNSQHSINGTYAWNHTEEPHGIFFRGTPGEFADHGNYLSIRTVNAPVVNYTWTPDSTSVVNLRWGYNAFRDDCVPQSAGLDLAKIGFDASYANALPIKQVPNFLFDTYQQIGGQNSFLATFHNQTYAGDYSRFFGRHNVRTGAMYRQLGVNFTDNGAATGVFQFDKTFTQQSPTLAAARQGDAIASLLLGYPISASLTTAKPLRYFSRYYASFIQDDFRATSRLTLNLGLRYEYETDMQEKDNQTTVGFDRTVLNPAASKIADPALRDRIRGGLMYAGVNGNNTHQGDPQKLGFEPRFGFAYSAAGNTVIRGGYGIFFAPLQIFGPSTAAYGSLGYAASTNPLASTDGNQTPALRLSNPFPQGVNKPTGNSLGLLQNVGGVVQFVDQNNKRGYVQQYSFDIQQQLPGGIAVTAGYVGSRLLHMSTGAGNNSAVNINQLPPEALALGSALTQAVPNPFFGIPEFGPLGTSSTITRGQLLRPFPEFQDVLMVRPSIGYGYYNAMTLKAERRLDSSGLGFRVNYTFAKLLDNYFGDSSFFGKRVGIALDNYNINREYGLSANDVRHSFNATPMWDLPLGKGKRWATSGIADRLLGGWNLTPVVSLQSGVPAQIWQNNNNAGTLGGTQRPNAVPGVDACSSGSVGDRLNHWFNDGLAGRPAAFTSAPGFTLGNVSRTINCRMPHQYNLDVSLRKYIQLTENHRIAIRVEAINVTNTPKFTAPETRLGNSSFGTIASEASFPRLIQYMLRYEF
jgi:trimeric autotransporter adhesin